MTLTPEKLDEIEQLAELATPGPWVKDHVRRGYSIWAGHPRYPTEEVVGSIDEDGLHGAIEKEADADLIAALDPATVRELVRLARIAEFLIETAESYGGWTGPELYPAEFHISWGTQQHSPVFEPLAELNEAAKRWAQEQLEEDEGHD